MCEYVSVNLLASQKIADASWLLPFHHVVPGGGNSALKLGSKHVYMLSHLTSPELMVKGESLCVKELTFVLDSREGLLRLEFL